MHKITKKEELVIDQGVVVIKFFATWCGPCKKMDPIVDILESEFNDCTFFAVNADDFPNIVSTYGVKSLPTIVFLKDGKEVKKVIGVSLIDPLRKLLRDMTE